jgi:hypothetical protein
MNLETALKPPVRVLIRTHPSVLDNSGPNADSKLIRTFTIQFFNANTTKVAIQHLITKVTRRAMIVFDYGVQIDGREPRVIAFDAKSDGSSISFHAFHHPQTQQLVNDTVKTWADQNSRHGWKFPSRTDLRQTQQLLSSNVSIDLISMVLVTNNVFHRRQSQPPR